MNFSDLVIALKLNTAAFTSAMNNVRRQTQRFASTLAQVSTDGTADRLVDGYRSLNDRLHNVGLSLRDIARISSGILVSQTFYGIARAVREATDALWAFNESLDYATVTYSALMGSQDTANDFITTLKQFSVDTIFEYRDIENMSRKLLSYGIEYKNLMYIIEGLTNIGTLSGDSAALERLAVAIGQINAKGVLKAEEVRQLANAYTPIYDILRDKMGLSDEDFKSIGDLGISSADAINAIVEYTNEQFGSVADAAMYTITGLNNRIVDTLKVMGADIMRPLTTFYKSLASYISESLTGIYDIYKQSGLGGVFEHLIPDKEWQHRIRQLLANLSNFIYQIIGLLHTLWPIIKSGIGGLIDGFSMLLTIVNVAASTVVAGMRSIASQVPLIEILSKALLTAAAAWVIFKIKALSAMAIVALRAALVSVAQAVVFLASTLMAHPIVFGLVTLGAVMLGLSANANNANSAISNLIKSLNSYSLGGKTADDILQVGDAMDSGTTDSDQFWQSMGDGAKDTEDAIDGAAGAAKKATKSLLSFDEVFKLNEPSDAGSGIGGDGSLDGIGDLADALSGLGQALVPEIPDLSSFTDDFVNTLYNSMWESLKTIVSGGMSGALIGGLVGFAIGGLVTKTMAGALAGAKLGSKIGAVVGVGFAGFWTDTYKKMEESIMKIAGGAAIGTLVGGLVGLVIGAFVTKTVDGALAGAKLGAGIGSLVGAGIGAFWSSMTDEMNHAIKGLIVGGATGAFIGGLVGFIFGAFSTKTLKGALEGAKHGAKIGALIGAGVGTVFGEAKTTLMKAISGLAFGISEGALVGALAGFIIGAFALRTLDGAVGGAKLGAKIGAYVGGVTAMIFDDAEKTISDSLINMLSSVTAASEGVIIGGFAGMIIGAIVGAFAGGIGALPGAKAGAALGAALGGLGSLLMSWLNNSGITEAFSAWLDGVWTSISNWFVKVGTDIGIWFAGVGITITTWFTDLWTTISSWFTNVWSSISTWFSNAGTNISSWFSNIWSSILMWFTTAWISTSSWFSTVWKGLTTWLSNAWTGITTWFSNLWNNITSWLSSVANSIGAWFANLWAGASIRLSVIWTGITSWFSNLWKNISTWFTNLGTSIKTWWGNLFNTNTWKSAWESVKEWFKQLWTDIYNWFSDLKASIGAWWDGLFSDKEITLSHSNLIEGSDVKTVGGNFKLGGHATGGIFNREHIARFAEGNKAEAVIPLQDKTAMQPFVDAISEGIIQGMLPTMVGRSTENTLPPMWVGTLIADERGLNQLFKKFEIYEAKEKARKGQA